MSKSFMAECMILSNFSVLKAVIITEIGCLLSAGPFGLVVSNKQATEIELGAFETRL